MNSKRRVYLRVRKQHRQIVSAAAALLCFGGPAAAQSLPADADTTCIVTPTQFTGWFHTTTITLNGLIDPANSLTFVPNSNCSFYQWSERMFLWLNSPTPVFYGGGGGRIFNSPTFFDVSPPNASGQRTLNPNVAGVLRPFPLPVRAAQVGPDGLQVVLDTAGRLVEVQPAKIAPSGKPLILDSKGRQVEVQSVTVANGKAVFLDKTGKPIAGAKPILERRIAEKAQAALRPAATAGKIPLPLKSNPMPIMQRFNIGGVGILIDIFGNLDPVEQGQADDSVLMTQNGSLVYYTIAVNDVYAYFLTGTKNGGITPVPTQFPTTTSDLTSIVNFALTKGVTFPDPNALAIEVKAAWVDAATLSNASSYVTMNAVIPTYTQNANATTWTASGTKTATLALVGMHVVGSTQGHPEMIWATFEHAGNTPLGTYTYNGSSGVETVTQSTVGAWLFSATNSTGPFDQAHMQTAGANIQAVAQNPPTPPPPFTVSASDTLRWKAFGGATDLLPLNLTVTSPTAANTDILSINNSVRGLLVSGDIRANYIFSGATWTFGGVAPTFNTAAPPSNNSNQVGTSFLTNSTMETYEQGSDSTSLHGATNCFSCHNAASSANPLSPGNPDGLSHIFSDIKPLP